MVARQAHIRLWRRQRSVHDGHVLHRDLAFPHPRLHPAFLLGLVRAPHQDIAKTRYGLGQMFASVCAKVSNDRDPFNYLTPIYTEWAVLVSLTTQRNRVPADRKRPCFLPYTSSYPNLLVSYPSIGLQPHHYSDPLKTGVQLAVATSKARRSSKG